MRLLEGDALEQLKTIESNSIDSCVTDPPAGISFMSLDWDGNKGGKDEWIKWLAGVFVEVRRVLKPGGHCLVWALPRTSHWTATSLEDAGFEVRDVITHHFGSGFPKSMDISKAIDKAAGAAREVTGISSITGKRKSAFSELRNDSDSGFYGVASVNQITAPATDKAKEWQGWGTGLKPASEHWILARKPIEQKNIAAQVLDTGTGGLNIDAGRINGGRYPSNLILSGDAVEMIDQQSGISKGGNGTGNKIKGGKVRFSNTSYANGNGYIPKRDYVTPTYADAGGASRFFYCPKPSQKEKNAGCENIEPKRLDEKRKIENVGSDVPQTRSVNPRQNYHPTVKSIELMTYLIKLITPAGCTVLDCFAGSGTTGIAAVTNGFDFVGIEKEGDYMDIAESRINYHKKAA